MVNTISAKLTEIIFVSFDNGEDLRQGMLKVIKEKNIRSGLVLSIAGALSNAHLQVWHRQVGTSASNMSHVEIPGPLEISGHGMIGQTRASAYGNKYFGPFDEFKDGEPYLHVHLTISTAEPPTTLCGHIMDGTTVMIGSQPRSHFTLVLGRIEGAGIQMCGEPSSQGSRLPWDFWHELVKF